MEIYTLSSRILLRIVLLEILWLMGACKNSIEQRKINVLDKNGKDSITYTAYITKKDTIKSGEYLMYQNGKLIGKLMFRNNQLNGWQEYYYPSGQIRERFLYKLGRAQDSGFFYYPNGQRELTTFYHNNVQLFSEKFYPNGDKELCNVFWPLKKDSIFYVVLYDTSRKEYYANGNLLSNSYEHFNREKISINVPTTFKLFCTQLPNFKLKVYFFADDKAKDTIKCHVESFYTYVTVALKKRGANTISLFAELYDEENALIQNEKVNIKLYAE